LHLVCGQIQTGLKLNENYSRLRNQKLIKKQIICIISNFIQVCHQNSISSIATAIYPELNLILEDYASVNPDFKDPEVLNLFAVFVKRINVDAN